MTQAISRRAFLRLTGGLAAGVGLASAGWPLGCAARSSATAPDWNRLARLLPGRVVRPGDAGFDQLGTPWNLRWSHRPRPAGVVLAASRDDARTAMLWARDHGVPLVARSGGHSYVGYSTTEGLLLDVSRMNGARFDPGSGRLVLGGVARQGDVYAALAPAGRTVTHARCPTVGVAGLVLGGGVGLDMRRIGLTCDQLVETEVVTATGDVLTCSAEHHADLFWAARGGGGGNFGIHTAFTFQTHAAPRLTVFRLVWRDRHEPVLRELLAALHAAPRELGVEVAVVARATADGVALAVTLVGQYAGPRRDLEDLLTRVYVVARPELGSDAAFLREVDYWEGQRLLAEPGAAEFWCERSRYAMEPLSDDAVGLICQRLREWPATGGCAMWKGRLTGGAVRAVAPDATAFVHRRGWLLSSVAVAFGANDAPDRANGALAWLDAFHDALRPHASDESYQNFIDDGATGWQRAYHGANLERRVAVKRAYDPDEVFRFAQSIPLSVWPPRAPGSPSCC